MANISIVVAIAENNAIGRNNSLIWHISDDLKMFKQLTSGHTIIMGRNTWDSLPKRPLPNRRHIVISHNRELMLEGAEVAHSVADTVKLCANNDESFVIGGAQVYAAFLHIANKLYLTRVKKSFEADTFFPVIDFDHWQLKSATPPQIDDNSNLEFVFEVYERVK